MADLFGPDFNFTNNGMEVDDNHTASLLIKADNFGVTTVTSLLKTISFCEKVNLYVSSAGVRFVVEEGKYVQGALFLKAELFKTFNCTGDPFGFKIPFKELLDCLKILGADNKNNTAGSNDTTDIGTAAPLGNGGQTRSMQITYKGYGTPFSLTLEEPEMTTEIELKTEDADGVIDFDQLQKIWEISMDSKLLHEYLSELEGYSPDNVTIRVVPNNCLQLRASGAAGSLKITIPKNCTGIERFCSVTTVHQSTFKFSILRYSFKLIQAADKVILQMSERQVLCLKLIFKETSCTIGEFHIVPLAEQDQDSDDGIDH